MKPKIIDSKESYHFIYPRLNMTMEELGIVLMDQSDEVRIAIRDLLCQCVELGRRKGVDETVQSIAHNSFPTDLDNWLHCKPLDESPGLLGGVISSNSLVERFSPEILLELSLMHVEE